ncbi:MULTISPECIES: hypothetical protein [Paenibacillus]|uniref:hypothetical protein n=1 Tax=Paenibacillus TaxID=44249 RepID=UPI000435DAAB|nr:MULTISPECIES: hypothetical protein [Paenibacillus]CDN45120.1 Putative uncharacterized protein [Paenibacillus sp. P22]
MDYLRDYAMYASVFGLFSFSWFGWAQENPPRSWRLYLGIASGIAMLVCLFGVYSSIRNWDAPSALNEARSFRGYLISVYAEVLLGGAGALYLIRTRKSAYVSAWISFVVGIHFIGLAGVFNDWSLHVLAALLVAVSVAASVLSRRLKLAVSALSGIGSGTALFAFAVLGMVRFLMA